MASNANRQSDSPSLGDASSSNTPSTIIEESQVETSKAEESIIIAPVQDVEKAANAISSAPPKEPYTAYSPSRQFFIVLIATMAGFFAPLCGAVYLPSLILFQDIFHATGSVINATVSVYMAVFAVTPLFGAAASDYGGRKSVYLVTLAIFIISNTLLAALPPTIGGLFTLRIFQALGSSVVTSIGAGTIADITEPSKRASRMGIFLLGPQLGPVLGPLIGGQFSDPGRWRWIFGFLSIACFPIYLLIIFFLPETLRCIVGNGSHFATSKRGIRAWVVKPQLRQKQIVEDGKYPKPPRPTPKSLFTLLFFVPNLIVTVGSALQFSGLYCIYVVFPRVWQKEYGWSGSETGYAYLVPGITLLIASLIVGRISDLRYRRFKAKHNGEAPSPEKRIDIQIWGYLIAAAGKVMFGWFVLKELHPVAALVASGLAAVGTGLVMVTSAAYQTECQPTAAASLVALSGLLRNVGSAISAAIIDGLLKGMGFGWCFTGLAILDAAYIAGLFFIRLRGHVYREKLTQAMKAGGK